MQGVTPFAYQSYDVLSWLPDGVLDRSGEWRKPFGVTVVPSGLTELRAPTDYGQHAVSVTYRCGSRADHASLRSFLEDRLGRVGAFWCPSFRRDFEVRADTYDDDTGLGTLTIRARSYNVLLASAPTACYLVCYDKGGSRQCVIKVSAAVDNGDGTETLTYSTNALVFAGTLGVVTDALPEKRGLVAAQLRLARLDSDSIATRWHTTEISDTKLTIVSLPEEQP